jgi:hypothetical protein
MCAGVTYEEFRHKAWFSAVAVLVGLQFVVFRYNPVAQVPTRADRVAGDRFISLLRELPGEVLVWSHGHYEEMAGKSRHAHDMAVGDASGSHSRPPRSEDNRWRRQLVSHTWSSGIRQQAFDWIVVDSATSVWRPYYLEAAPIEAFPRVFTGLVTRPRTLLVKNPLVNGGQLDLAAQRLNFLFGAGWGPPEQSGRLLIGENATVAVALEPGSQYQVHVTLQASCGSVLRKAIVGIWWNSRLLDRRTLAGCGSEEVISTVTPDSIDPGGNTLRLDTEPSIAGSAMSSSDDAWRIRMTALSVDRTGSPAGRDRP